MAIIKMVQMKGSEAICSIRWEGNEGGHSGKRYGKTGNSGDEQ